MDQVHFHTIDYGSFADWFVSLRRIMSEQSTVFKPAAWVHSTNIYEVNLRQYTTEGTFAAFAKHLPRLKEMGVDVLWFMPITPISFTQAP